MKRLIFAVTTLLAPSIAAAPASAAMMSCTSENMAKSVTASTAMPESPEKMAMMKEMGAANAAMSKGDMKGACRSYMRAQKMGAAKPSAGMKM
jgi:hypothetical protein